MTVQTTEPGRVPEAPKPLANEGRGYTVDEAAAKLKSLFNRREEPPPDQPPEALPQRIQERAPVVASISDRLAAADEDDDDDRRSEPKRGPDGRFKSADDERNSVSKTDAAPSERETSGDKDQAEADPEPEAPTIEPPRSWDAQQRDIFAKLVQSDDGRVAAQAILAHETRRDAELRRIQNETAERAKAHTEALTAAQAERQNLSAVLSEVQTHLKTDLAKTEAEIAKYAQIDWDRAFADDPVKAMQADRHYRNLVERKRDLIDGQNAARQQQDELAAKTRAEQETAAREHAAKERARLIEAVPEWKEPAKFHAGLGEVAEYLESQGIPRDRIAAIVDADSIMIARKAMKWDRLQTQKPATQKRVEAAPKMAAPTATQEAASRQDDEKAKAEARLRRTGSVDDLAAVLRLKGHTMSRPQRR